MPHATSSGLDWPFRSRKRLEKKLADSAVREVTAIVKKAAHDELSKWGDSFKCMLSRVPNVEQYREAWHLVTEELTERS